MSVYLREIDDIYFTKTREYFQEVLSSYSNGNYRSAVVMLYSVAICDILFKLRELKDMFNDTVADEILKEVEKCRNEHDITGRNRSSIVVFFKGEKLLREITIPHSLRCIVTEFSIPAFFHAEKSASQHGDTIIPPTDNVFGVGLRPCFND